MAESVVKLETGEWERFMRDALGRLKDATTVMLQLGKIHGFQDIIDHFRQQEGPDGSWPKRKASTQERYRRIGRGDLKPPAGIARAAFNPSNRLLQLTGNLRQSLLPAGTAKGSGKIKSLGRNTVQLLTTVEYAGAHEHGTKTIPARPFMWLSGRARDRIADGILKYVAGN